MKPNEPTQVVPTNDKYADVRFHRPQPTVGEQAGEKALLAGCKLLGVSEDISYRLIGVLKECRLALYPVGAMEELLSANDEWQGRCSMEEAAHNLALTEIERLKQEASHVKN